ncbi:substrate-binding periplasmic protein [Pseudoduganella violaceinigra]|uniref:substrate-binding periplasmic protein n=1 Tax=Pseudoduganella violaceinigra TaxID=246602 RepID=UPI0004067221|nr:transporter substrate-binding domain-containing protein [Pseudoduganella violaceinigra]
MDAPLRRRVLACLPGWLVFLCPLPAAGAGPLRAAVIQVEPYGVIDADGRQSGAYTEIFGLLASQLGRPIDVVVAPYARSLALLRSGGVEMMMAMPSPFIAEVAVPGGGVWALEAIVIGRSGQDLRGSGDLHGLTVARIRGTDYGPSFMQDPAIRHYEMTSHVQGLQMLLEKRVDAVVGGRPGIFHAMRKLGIRRAQLGASFVVQVKEVQLHLSKRSAEPELAAELRRGIAALRAAGRIDAVLAKYSAGLPRD